MHDTYPDPPDDQLDAHDQGDDSDAYDAHDDFERDALVSDEDGLHVGDPEDATSGATPFKSELDRALTYGAFPMDELLGALAVNGASPAVRGLKGAMAGIVLVELQRRLKRPLLILGAHTEELRVLAEDIAFFADAGADATLLVPSVDVSPYSGLSPNRARVADRLAACFKLLYGEYPPFVLVPVSGIVRRVPPRAMIEQLSDVIAVGTELELPLLRQRLLDIGYSPVQLVEDPGTFAIRGGLVDIYSPTMSAPARIELWGDEVETLRAFDPVTQKGGDTIDGLYLCPVREEVFTTASLATARDKLRALADAHHFPTRALRKVLAELGNGTHFLGIEALLPAFFDSLDCLLDFVPDEALPIVFEPERLEAEARRLFDETAAQQQRRVEAEELTFPHEDLFVAPEAIRAWLAGRAHVVANPVASGMTRPFDFPAINNNDVVRLRRERGAGEGAVHALVHLLTEWREVYGEIAFACRTTGNAERLAKLLRAYGQKTEVMGEATIDASIPHAPPAGTLRVYRSGLSAGARIPARGLALVTDEELFGPRVRRKAKNRRDDAARFIAAFRELKPGDFLVHVEHGIGRYTGLIKLEVGAYHADFLCIEYAEDDKLYIPVHRLESVQKYSGGEAPKRVDKLGGSQWERVKARVKEGIKRMAIDLLELYAERQSRSGYTFSPVDEYFQEFEVAFPFDETPDQGAAIEAVIEDMQTPRPMERLICGDVGFGKTEVAMRGAFKAVLDSKQVAVLVPTTILAEQHLQSFRARLAEYPVRVEALSRFRSAKEVKAILKDLEVGKVDIVIGTHRLLSQDVIFKDLGLLVVDEEHRFGVTHKEKIRAMSVGVDTLTMTATPIPRTLQMSLLGLRDLSVISTPPEDRLAVRTYVAKEDDEVIREAITRELQRGGQVYFLHNRVQTIELRASEIRELVPHARIAIAHGQMDERKLEKVMLGFIRGETNVLVCTTIIESGLDIPNANCLIVSRADNLGLAQLYQIRGRVGRSNQRAHCYLLIPGEGAISGDARERLEAIERFTDLGSGMEIAQFDLELRGAGNLLGAEQSGHVAAVGLDLYSELLEETIAELRGEESTRSVEPEVNLPLEAHLPEEYLPDVQLRLLFYKRLSSARDEEEIFEIYGELQDRFGTPPPPVEALREIFEVKLMVRKLRAAGVDANHTAIIVNIGEDSLLDPGMVVALVTSSRRRYLLRPDMRLVHYLKPAESEDLVATTKRFLTELAGCLRAGHGA